MTPGQRTRELYLGLMSGTSMDGVDAALVDFSETAPVLIDADTWPLPPHLQQSLTGLVENPAGGGVDHVGELDIELGQLFADVVLALLGRSGVIADEVSAIGCHGQTVRHSPAPPHPHTLQLGDPNIIAARTGIDTVTDFRRRDLALGGQGAPLAPAFHAAVFRHPALTRTIVNIGGIANLTVLPANGERVTGFDSGPGNGLMDTWIHRCLGHACDRGGAWAADGKVHTSLLSTLLAETYLKQQPPKSTGRDHFGPVWLEQKLGTLRTRPPDVDIQATLCEFTARTIAEAIHTHAADTRDVLVCGGGVHNHTLMRRLDDCLQQACGRAIPVNSTDSAGIHPDHVEAMAFAWLARQRIQALPGNLPEVTGAARPAVLGGIYSGK